MARHEAHGEYKSNRIIAENDPRYESMMDFFRQKDVILNLLNAHFPVSVVRHPTFEADDTIANLISTSSSSVDWIVVSSDSDFTQLLQKHDNVKLYNPVKKEFVVPPYDYDYVVWKALRGDTTDNIPGIPGIGDKTAEKIACDPDLLAEKSGDAQFSELFSRNYELISFHEWSDEERVLMTSSSPQKNWSIVYSSFSDMDFKSIVKEDSWKKFVDTFEKLWG